MAYLRQPAKDGAPRRAHLEAAAARGNPRALAALQPPPFPEALRGLWEQFERLDLMRDVGFNGPCRFTPAHLHSAAVLFDWTWEPHEVEALVTLDLVMLQARRSDDGPAPDWPG